MKLCADCRYYELREQYVGPTNTKPSPMAICIRPIGPDPVHGKVLLTADTPCRDERSRFHEGDLNFCGPRGTFFEPKTDVTSGDQP